MVIRINELFWMSWTSIFVARKIGILLLKILEIESHGEKFGIFTNWANFIFNEKLTFSLVSSIFFKVIQNDYNIFEKHNKLYELAR